MREELGALGMESNSYIDRLSREVADIIMQFGRKMGRLSNPDALTRQIEKLAQKKDNCERVLKGLQVISDVEGMETAARNLRETIKITNEKMLELKKRIQMVRVG